MKTELQNIQIALFFQNTFSGSFEGILSDYEKEYSNIIGNRIPLPDDFPEDSFPRLEIKHNDKNIIIRFSKNRADMFLKSFSAQDDFLDDFLNRVIDLGITVGRIGFIVKTVYSDIDMSYLHERFSILSLVDSNEDILEVAQRLNKRTVINFNDKKITCNNIAILTFGEKDNKPALLLERDVNTFENINLSLKNSDSVKEMLNLLESEAEVTLYKMD